MYELPLFPLNTVLFPGMPLNLHIFEERYKLMVNECLEKRQPFGVILIAENKPDTSRSVDTHLVGCTAQITQVQPLSQGRMNIAAIGRERFRVVSLHHDRPYLYAMVEALPLIDRDPLSIARLYVVLQDYLEKYLRILEDAGQIQFGDAQLPRDPLALAFLAAVLLKVPSETKQDILAASGTLQMLLLLCRLYRAETALLKIMLNPPDQDNFTGAFSLN